MTVGVIARGVRTEKRRGSRSEPWNMATLKIQGEENTLARKTDKEQPRRLRNKRQSMKQTNNSNNEHKREKGECRKSGRESMERREEASSVPNAATESSKMRSENCLLGLFS